MTAEPIVPFVPTADDPDWETIRARIAAQLAASAAPEWTDHNAAEPGITLGESAAFGLADLHYRLAESSFSSWPLEWEGWRPATDRHWHTALPLAAPAEPPAAPVLGPLAASLAACAEELEPLVRGCATRADADAVLAEPTWAALVPAAVAPAVIGVLRGRYVRQIAQEHAHVVADAVAHADSLGGTRAARDSRAAAELSGSLPLWTDELAGLVRRERSRLARDTAAAHSRAIALATTPAMRSHVVAGLEVAGLTADEAAAATARTRIPAGMMPEDLEGSDGQTRIWPPHPVQALSCEPVIAADYATRARQHPHVGRAWAVPGRLAGVTWHGLPVFELGETPPVVGGLPWPAELTWRADPLAAAVTLVVDRIAGTANPREFLRNVLALAIGSEVRHPFPIWRDNVDALDPRRLIGDEVGAAILKRVEVVVSATLVLPVTADTAAVIADVAARIARFFEEGRPERLVEAPAPDLVEGPWPPAPQPPGGWFPGEAIRFTEVVEVMVGNPEVIGVKEVFMKINGAGPMIPASGGSLELPAGSVPVLAAGGCLESVVSVTGGCSDA